MAQDLGFYSALNFSRPFRTYHAGCPRAGFIIIKESRFFFPVLVITNSFAAAALLRFFLLLPSIGDQRASEIEEAATPPISISGWQKTALREMDAANKLRVLTAKDLSLLFSLTRFFLPETTPKKLSSTFFFA